MKFKDAMYQDEAGQWWIPTKIGRARCTEGVCGLCNTPFVRYPGHKETHCGRLCAQKCRNKEGGCEHNFSKPNRVLQGGELSPNWKGGKTKRKGYIMVWKPDHPSIAHSQTKYIPEHRLVMEDYLGRLLLRHEEVHHINGVKDDNRIENLELWSTSQPAGQRVEDKLKWAKEIIEQYDGIFTITVA